MYVARYIAEVCRDIPFNEGAVYLAALVVNLVHHPYPACNRDFLAGGRRLDIRAELLGAGAHSVFDVFLEHRVELIIVDNPLSGKPDNQPAVFRAVDMINFDKVSQQDTEVILADAAEGGKRQHAGGKLTRRHLTAGGKRAHRLVIEQGKRQPFRARRFHKALFDIQLDKRNPLDKIPRDHLRQQSPRFGMVFPHDKPHFRRVTTPTGTSHAL